MTQPNDDFPEDWSDFDQWKKSYKPESNKGFAPGPEMLDDGGYMMQIIAANLIRTQPKEGKAGQWIFRLGYRVLSGDKTGLEIERPYFINTERDNNTLGGDLLLTLGQDHKSDGPTLKALAPKLVGLKVSCRKRTWLPDPRPGQPPPKPFHILDITSVIKGAPMPTRPEAPANPFATAAPPAVNSPTAKVPF